MNQKYLFKEFVNLQKMLKIWKMEDTIIPFMKKIKYLFKK